MLTLCVDTASIWIMLCIHKKGPSWVLRDPTQCNDGILTHRAKQLIGVVRLTINWSSLHVGSPFARTELKRGFDTWDLGEVETRDAYQPLLSGPSLWCSRYLIEM
ncbi:hypothetical protein SCLCIDRAFT_1224545 [Scleroderma citrinum Foug A]|uniref:Uncharacterized protein n=1 Tax=Scleroderma citrinum Foug A TaxID=1036808 RepID=A0A0C2ZEQ8_9AGAM|nr:hypothetical protein SCLCIDRAFT_1224545 [Scleroderma citrinum Foug A]